MNKKVYLVMEYIDGLNLEEHMTNLRREKTWFDEPKACHYIK
jgi:hypothetical protein